MLIVLDRSFSMSQNGKWDAARQAIIAITPSRDSVMRFGLMVFPTPGYACGGGKSLVACDLFAADAISLALQTQHPGGETPTADAIATAAARPDMTDSSRRRFVVLITDGDPTCPVQNNPDASLVPAIEQVQKLYAAGIETFVIGFGSGVTPARLDRLADAGGTARVGATCTNPAAPGTIPCKYYEASDQASLQTAFDAIVQVASGELQGFTCDDSCYTGAPCPAGQRCVKNLITYGTIPPYTLNPGQCVTDPCASVTCGSGQFCREGQCVSACSVACTAGQMCQDGSCVPDPCASSPASCTCGGPCPQNLVCLDGTCQDDPCRYVKCPSEASFCSMGSCYVGPPAPRGGGVTPASGSGRSGASKAGGCSCGDTGAALLPSLVLVPWALRRRRRGCASAGLGSHVSARSPTPAPAPRP